MANKVYRILFLIITLIGNILASCDYKSLDDIGQDLQTVQINFGWDRVDSIPKAMRVAFYPTDAYTKGIFTKGYTFFDLPKNIWPSTIQLPAGIYDVVAWNNDTEHVLTDKYGNQTTLHATTQPYVARGTFDTPSVIDSIYNGQKVLDYPDYMVHATHVDFEVPQYTNGEELVLLPDSMVVTIEYKVHGIGGLSWVKQVRGAVDNVAGKRFMAYKNRTEETVSVMFDCSYSQEDSLVYGSFCVFGIEPTEIESVNHKMVLFFWMDGGKVYLPIDVTDAFNAYRQEDKKICIEIPSLNIDLRDYISSKNTFEVDLDEWDNVYQDIGF